MLVRKVRYCLILKGLRVKINIQIELKLQVTLHKTNLHREWHKRQNLELLRKGLVLEKVINLKWNHRKEVMKQTKKIYNIYHRRHQAKLREKCDKSKSQLQMSLA